MNINETQRYKIQLLRGVAIVAVVAIHNIPIGNSQILVRPFVNFAVPLFLFLSGFLSKRETKTLKRIKKIIFPYCVWTLFYTMILCYHDPKQLLNQYPKRLIAADSAGIMYYVFVYCSLTLLIPLIDKLARSRFRIIGFLISPAEIIIMRMIPMVLGISINKYLEIVVHISFVGWFSYFYLGYLLGNKIINIKFGNKMLTTLLVVFLGLQIVEGYLYKFFNYFNPGTALKLSSFFTSMILMLFFYKFLISGKAFKNKILKLLGDCSFGIYFSHLAIMVVLLEIPHYDLINVFPINVIIVLSISTCFVLIGRKILGRYAKYLAL